MLGVSTYIEKKSIGGIKNSKAWISYHINKRLLLRKSMRLVVRYIFGGMT